MTKENPQINKASIDKIAELWVNLVLAQIEAKKQENHTYANKKGKANYKIF